MFTQVNHDRLKHLQTVCLKVSAINVFHLRLLMLKQHLNSIVT